MHRRSNTFQFDDRNVGGRVQIEEQMQHYLYSLHRVRSTVKKVPPHPHVDHKRKRRHFSESI